MLSSIRKIFQNKPIKSFELDYEEDYYKRKDKQLKENSVNKRDVLIGNLIRDDSTILDIGCGDGSLLAYLLKQKKNIEILGIDISQDTIRIANKRGVKAKYMDITNTEIPKDWIFDYIIMADFIEHVPDPERLLSKIRNCFREKIIISIPNIGYITSRLRLMIGGRFPIQWGRHPGEHLRFWTVNDFFGWARQLDYQVQSVIPVHGPFLKKIFPSLFSKKNIFVLIRKLANKK